MSEHSGTVLSTDQRAGNQSWVWLEKDHERDEQRWRLAPTEDKVAFVIETAKSSYAIDATKHPRLPASEEARSISDPTEPQMWETHSAAWQQWLVVRLPLR